jgi:hypothetical protein
MWPPTPMKVQAEAEKHPHIKLVKNLVSRPQRVNKNYSELFAQHSSTNNYSVYQAPPNTQYFIPVYQH